MPTDTTENSKWIGWLIRWKKTIWWAGLLVIFFTYLFSNQYRILSETPTSIDYLVVILWLILLLYPLFSEIDIAGVKLKKEIETLRTEVKDQMLTIRTELHNTANFQNINYIGYTTLPAPDPKLRQIQTEYFQDSGLIGRSTADTRVDFDNIIDIPQNNITLFKVRLTLETELQRILKERVDRDWGKRPLSSGQMIKILVESELIDLKLYRVLLEVNNICNQAVHNRPITAEQYEFVTKLFPDIINRLKDL